MEDAGNGLEEVAVLVGHATDAWVVRLVLKVVPEIGEEFQD